MTSGRPTPPGAWGYRRNVDDVRLHLTDGQVVRLVVPSALAWAAVAGIAVRAGAVPAVVVALVASALISVAGLYGGLRRWGAVLTSRSLVLVGRRRVEVPWGEVRSVRVERRSLGAHVVVETGRGRRRLPAPVDGVLAPDPHFDEKAVFVQRWWRSCAPAEGPDGPAPPGGDTGWGLRVLPGEVGPGAP